MGFEHFTSHPHPNGKMHAMPEGQSADLRTSLTHGQHKTILRGIARASEDPALRPDVVDGYLLAFVTGWSVKDEAGTSIEWPDDADGQRAALERAPELVTAVIFERCVELYAEWRKDADPNDSSGTSTASPPA
jgi:hypothetical protein